MNYRVHTKVRARDRTSTFLMCELSVLIIAVEPAENNRNVEYFVEECCSRM